MYTAKAAPDEARCDSESMSLLRTNRTGGASRWTIVVAFAIGLGLGVLVAGRRNSQLQTSVLPPSSVTHISQLARQGVSHNPEIEKVVLAGKAELPHVTQIAIATLRPGQVASRNQHQDMGELFYFLSGNGIVELGNRNHSVRAGSIVKALPPTPHTIWNLDKSEDLTLMTVASV